MRMNSRLVCFLLSRLDAIYPLEGRSEHSSKQQSEKQRSARGVRGGQFVLIFSMALLAGVSACSHSQTGSMAPAIVSLSQISGVVGTSITITGMNFGATQGASTVTFNGTAATAIASWTATSIVVTVPAGATTGNVVVTVGGQASNGSPFTVGTAGSVTVTISPVRAAIIVGQVQPFTAMVTGNANTSVTWEVDSVMGGTAATGTIDGNGNYTAPSTGGTHTIGARSVANPLFEATAPVYVSDLTAISTYHNDQSRDGSNPHEFALTPATVNTATFGKRFSCTLDAPAYAQPLWIGNVTILGAKHNILIAVSMQDTVYAFDADASPCQTYWSASAIPAGETWVTASDLNALAGCGNYTTVGIVGTPVIDLTTNTVYFAAETKTTGAPTTVHWRVHAISLIDGSEKFGGPMDISSASGTKPFKPVAQGQRPGLALVNGVVYIAFGGLYGDCNTYSGWVFGYSASTLSQVSAFPVDPVDGYGAIWMAGGAPGVDASNNIYVITGNGDMNSVSDFGDSFLKFGTSGGFTLSSFFAPYNQAALSAGDLDLGSGGLVLIDPASGPVPHLIIGGGKEGILYLLNRDSLGGYNPANNNAAIQTFTVTPGEILSSPSVWNNTLYLAPVGKPLQTFTFTPATGLFTTVAGSASAESFSDRGATVTVSSQGLTNGVVWAIDIGNAGVSVLRAYDATNLATELWNSSMVAGDKAGGKVEFAVPTVANGKVYIGTTTEITVYGLLPK